MLTLCLQPGRRADRGAALHDPGDGAAAGTRTGVFLLLLLSLLHLPAGVHGSPPVPLGGSVPAEESQFLQLSTRPIAEWLLHLRALWFCPCPAGGPGHGRLPG